MSASDTTAQQSLLHDVDALVAAIMADAPVVELIAITDRIAVAVDYWDGIPAHAIAELRSAIDLMCGGKPCTTISALLTARSALNTAEG
ncbi:MAG: hypothetical protein ACRDRA_03910 [Pseudonocardiaceae bacterium]